jgi:hypothetical protein
MTMGGTTAHRHYSRLLSENTARRRKRGEDGRESRTAREAHGIASRADSDEIPNGRGRHGGHST